MISTEQKSVNPFSTPTGISINEIASNLKSKNLELPSNDTKKKTSPGKKEDSAASYTLVSTLLGDTIANQVAIKPAIIIPKDKKNLVEKVEQVVEKVNKVESVVSEKLSRRVETPVEEQEEDPNKRLKNIHKALVGMGYKSSTVNEMLEGAPPNV